MLLWLLLAVQLPSARVIHEQGVAEFKAGRLDQAADYFMKATQLDPKLASAWKALGVVHAARGANDLAREPFEKACALDRKEPDACYYRARNLYLLNRFEESRIAYLLLLRQEGATSRIRNGLGLSLEALGHSQEAEREYRAAVESRPTGHVNEHPLINLGVLLGRQGRTTEAVTCLREAVGRVPASARAHFEFGRALQETGGNPEAAAELEKAITIEPSRWAAHVLLGKIYLRMGREEEGRRHLATDERGLTGARAR
ncbi:MAG: tetratricopeptide repeat protein [Acidobacteriia bacterium]|nr:tetratricopeptide repeat protein [Terriglobia bacterium]